MFTDGFKTDDITCTDFTTIAHLLFLIEPAL